jgi:hypothetical protein
VGDLADENDLGGGSHNGDTRSDKYRNFSWGGHGRAMGANRRDMMGTAPMRAHVC